MINHYGVLIIASFLTVSNGYPLRRHQHSASSRGYHQGLGFYPHGFVEESSVYNTEGSTITTSSTVNRDSSTSKSVMLTSTSSREFDTSTEEITSSVPKRINHDDDLEFDASFTANTRRTTTVVPSFVLDLITTFSEPTSEFPSRLTTSSTSEAGSTKYVTDFTSVDKSTTAEYEIPVESSDEDYSKDSNSDTTTTTITTTSSTSEPAVSTTIDVHPTTILTLNTKYTTEPTTLFYRRTSVATTEPSLDDTETSTSVIIHDTTYTDPKTTTSESNLGTTVIDTSPSTSDEPSTSRTGVSSAGFTKPSLKSTDSPVDAILRKLSTMKHPKRLLELLKDNAGSKTLTSKLSKKRWKLLQNILKSFRGK